MRLVRVTSAPVRLECERLYRAQWGFKPYNAAAWAWWAVDGFPRLGNCAAQITADGTTVRLEHAWTSAEFRGQGLQSRMIRARVEFGRRRGVDKAYTYTYVDNVKSQRNLSRAGFLLVRVFTSKDGEKWMVYEKALRS